MQKNETVMPGLTLYLDDIRDLQSSDLSYDELGRFLTLIFAYFTDGIEPDGLKGLEQIAFRRFSVKIDRCREKYDETCERNRANSRKKTASAAKPAESAVQTTEARAESEDKRDTPLSPAPADREPEPVPAFAPVNWPESPFHPEPGDEEMTLPEPDGDEGELINLSVYDDVPIELPPARQPVSDVPTREEVKREIALRGYTHSDNFFDYYAALGWRIGSSPIRSWKSALNVFEKRGVEHEKHIAEAEKRSPAAPAVRPGSFLDYPQRPCADRNDLMQEYLALCAQNAQEAGECLSS